MALLEICNGFIDELQMADDYIDQIYRLFSSMCETKENLIEDLPMLYLAVKRKNISKKYSDIQKELTNYINEIDRKLSTIRLEKMDISTDVHPDDATADGDLLLFLCLETRKGNKNRDLLFKEVKMILKKLCTTTEALIHGNRFYELNKDDDRIYHLVDIALENEKDVRYIYLEKDKKAMVNIRKTMELFDLNNLLNIYRQSFIQIMSYFDTCIFSMMEQCMEDDFFSWLSRFENSSLKTHDIAKCKSFDKFKNKQIQIMLKKCYVKDLLQIIWSTDPKIFVIDGDDTYAKVQEMISRRNVHIHHKGIVDKQYAEKFNIDRYSLGDYLAIDEEYLNQTEFILKKIVNNIVERFELNVKMFQEEN